jgi:hypothetical protein
MWEVREILVNVLDGKWWIFNEILAQIFQNFSVLGTTVQIVTVMPLI